MIIEFERRQRELMEIERWAVRNELALTREGWISYDQFERLLWALREAQQILDNAISAEEDNDYGYRG